MKNFPLLMLLVFLFSCNALFGQGKQFQAGVGGLPIIYPNNSAQTGYSLRVNLGYYLSKKLTIGIMPFVGQVETISAQGANIYSRYYFTDAKLSIFVEGAIGLGRVKYQDVSQLDGVMNSISLGPGVDYKISQVLKLELLLQYARLVNVSFPEQTYTGDTFIPTIGLQYIISR